MLTPHVIYHKDGHYLAINKVPWWMPVYEWLVHRLMPCCGLAGFLSRWDWPGDKLMLWSTSLSFMPLRRGYEREVFKVQIPHGCVASHALWPEHDDPEMCIWEPCPVHVTPEQAAALLAQDVQDWGLDAGMVYRDRGHLPDLHGPDDDRRSMPEGPA